MVRLHRHHRQRPELPRTVRRRRQQPVREDRLLHRERHHPGARGQCNSGQADRGGHPGHPGRAELHSDRDHAVHRHRHELRRRRAAMLPITPPRSSGATTMSPQASSPPIQRHADTFLVAGTNTYASPGPVTVNVTVKGKDGGGAVAQGSVTVADAGLTVTGLDINATAKQTFHGQVASFSVTNGQSSGFTATIFWGDGQVARARSAPTPASRACSRFSARTSTTRSAPTRSSVHQQRRGQRHHAGTQRERHDPVRHHASWAG